MSNAFAAVGVLALLAGTVLACDAQAEAALPMGVYQGGGRACAGTLKITRRTTTWRTPFSDCGVRATTASNVDTEPAGSAWLLVRQGAAGRCRYPVIVLRRHSGGAESGWEAVGFPNLVSQRGANLDRALACPLVKIR